MRCTPLNGSYRCQRSIPRLAQLLLIRISPSLWRRFLILNPRCNCYCLLFIWQNSNSSNKTSSKVLPCNIASKTEGSANQRVCRPVAKNVYLFPKHAIAQIFFVPDSVIILETDKQYLFVALTNYLLCLCFRYSCVPSVYCWEWNQKIHATWWCWDYTCILERVGGFSTYFCRLSLQTKSHVLGRPLLHPPFISQWIW